MCLITTTVCTLPDPSLDTLFVFVLVDTLSELVTGEGRRGTSGGKEWEVDRGIEEAREWEVGRERLVCPSNLSPSP